MLKALTSRSRSDMSISSPGWAVRFKSQLDLE
jgi:hypothetical protein